MDATERIIERIRKMHAKAESAKEIGSLHEAETFAAAVQKMLLKYKLDLAQVGAAGVLEELVNQELVDWSAFGYKETSRRTPWIELLAARICDPLNCRLLVAPGTNRVGVIGLPVDRAVAIFLIGKLVPKAEDLSHAANYQRRLRGVGTHGYRKSWLLGFAHGIGKKMADEYRKEEQQSSGLAMIRHRDSAKVDAFAEQFSRGRRVSMRVDSASGMRDGNAAAQREDVRARAAGAGDEVRQLAGGAK